MKLTYKDKTYDLKFGFKAMIVYEKITGSTFNGGTIESLVIALYSCILAADSEFTEDFTVFCDWLDDNPEVLTDFITFISKANKRAEIVDDSSKEDTGEDAPKND